MKRNCNWWNNNRSWGWLQVSFANDGFKGGTWHYAVEDGIWIKLLPVSWFKKNLEGNDCTFTKKECKRETLLWTYQSSKFWQKKVTEGSAMQASKCYPARNCINYPKTLGNFSWNFFHSYKQTPSEDDMDSYFEKAKSWLNLFTSLHDKRLGYRSANITPYMHSMIIIKQSSLKPTNQLNFSQGRGSKKNMAKSIVLHKSNKWML